MNLTPVGIINELRLIGTDAEFESLKQVVENMDGPNRDALYGNLMVLVAIVDNVRKDKKLSYKDKDND
jgi:hypothetical protein